MSPALGGGQVSGLKPREARQKVMIPARMCRDGTWFDVCIRDISTRGLQIHLETPPPRGSYVELRRAKHVIIGRVVWSRERGSGIQTQDCMDVAGIIRGAALRGKPLARNAVPHTGVASTPSARRSAEGIARRLERSRRFSSAFEFGCVVALAVAAAGLFASTVRQTLAGPLDEVAGHLAATDPTVAALP